MGNKHSCHAQRGALHGKQAPVSRVTGSLHGNGQWKHGPDASGARFSSPDITSGSPCIMDERPHFTQGRLDSTDGIPGSRGGSPGSMSGRPDFSHGRPAMSCGRPDFARGRPKSNTNSSCPASHPPLTAAALQARYNGFARCAPLSRLPFRPFRGGVVLKVPVGRAGFLCEQVVRFFQNHRPAEVRESRPSNSRGLGSISHSRTCWTSAFIPLASSYLR